MLNDLLPEELAQALAPMALPPYRLRQIFSWLQRRGAQSAGEMTDLPRALRETLAAQYTIASCKILRTQQSADGTRKYLFGLHDGNTVESVVMSYEHGRSICVSTQVGCKMACAFCASGLGGFTRGLSPGEMLAQLHAARQNIGGDITHVVLMGMGEPLDNYDNVLQFLRLLSHPEGLCISPRRVSLSTSGLVPQIDRLAGERLGLTLSVSLHAPNNALRSELMPVNRRYPLEELLAACARYCSVTSRRISFEYAMFMGVNDSAACAEELSALLKKQRRGGTLHSHVNLIPANPLPGSGFRRSGREAVRAFQGILETNGINVTVRRSLGQDIEAACGQLRQQTSDEV